MSLLDLVTLASSRLPDPGQPSIIAWGASVGALGGGLPAWLRRLPGECVSRRVMYGSLLGGACGVVVYLAMFLL